jgi:hypothetical protein
MTRRPSTGRSGIRLRGRPRPARGNSGRRARQVAEHPRADSGEEVDLGQFDVGVGQLEPPVAPGVVQAQAGRVLAEQLDQPHHDLQPARRGGVEVAHVEQPPRGQELTQEALLVRGLRAAVFLGEATGLGGEGHEDLLTGDGLSVRQ